VKRTSLTKLEVFPNPSAGIFNLKGLNNIEKLIIVNSLGQEQAFKFVEVQDGFRIIMEKVSAGIYYLVDSETGSGIELLLSQ
jgi:hypothetical protein